jgi:hypothetical protein
MMLHPRPLSLTDRQMVQVNIAAALLPPQDRDAFLRKLADRLGSSPSNDALAAAIAATLPPRGSNNGV